MTDVLQIFAFMLYDTSYKGININVLVVSIQNIYLEIEKRNTFSFRCTRA